MADYLLWDHDVRALTGRTPAELDLVPVMRGSTPKYRQSEVYKHADPANISYWESMRETAEEGEHHELQHQTDDHSHSTTTADENYRRPRHNKRRRRRAGWTRVGN